MRRSTGFTLIELMIAVAIVAILAAIALPSYADYLKRGRITDAVSQLSGLQVKLEQFFQDHRTYAGACVDGTIAPLPASTPSFSFSCPTLNGSAYQIAASGVGSMGGFSYQVNQANQKSSVGGAGWASSGSCWILKKDGSC